MVIDILLATKAGSEQHARAPDLQTGGLYWSSSPEYRRDLPDSRSSTLVRGPRLPRSTSSSYLIELLL